MALINRLRADGFRVWFPVRGRDFDATFLAATALDFTVYVLLGCSAVWRCYQYQTFRTRTTFDKTALIENPGVIQSKRRDILTHDIAEKQNSRDICFFSETSKPAPDSNQPPIYSDPAVIPPWGNAAGAWS